MSPGRTLAPAGVLIAVVMTACRPPPPSANRPLPSAPVVVAAPAAPAARPVVESPRAHDPRWLAARDPDPLAKARLAALVGAAELLAGVADGGETAETALAALPYAQDGEVALAPLAELAASDAAKRHRLLAAILAIAGQPRSPRDPLDEGGARRCGEVMLGLAADATVAREDRALAVSAARALAERGFVEAALVSGALDPDAGHDGGHPHAPSAPPKKVRR